jgi:hypothetical protein
VSVRDILSKELDIVSSDELNSESEGECPSDESSNTLTENERESETSVCTDGWEDALPEPNFQAKQLTQWLCGDLKSPLRPGFRDFSKHGRPERVKALGFDNYKVLVVQNLIRVDTVECKNFCCWMTELSIPCPFHEQRSFVSSYWFCECPEHLSLGHHKSSYNT